MRIDLSPRNLINFADGRYRSILFNHVSAVTVYSLLDPFQNAQHLDKGAYTSGCEIG
jgi:hypothetical protein